MTIERLQNESWFRHHMIYTLEPIHHSRYNHLYLPLNRHYKPLGVITTDWLDYENYTSQAMVFKRDPHSFTSVWWKNDSLHMYNDGVESRETYFPRLEKLLSYQILVPKELVYEHRRSV